ncbi:Protein CBG23967 [Caenorhabditis briggsae]|uniref:Protein CBG23967 n=1 Tax=Caenorhabditis briggsae TaxID=6238 RepID=A8WJP3_CAEBR|nr:Protein CBG23967 [Caenorhabditis briggsae]CAP20686.2 Protein CBG23967 [Caenorhabditis briggsae]
MALMSLPNQGRHDVLLDGKVRKTTKQLGPRSWPRPQATEKQMREIGQVKKRSMEAKRKLEAMEQEKRRMKGQKERRREDRRKIVKDEEETAWMQQSLQGLQEKRFLLHSLLIQELGDLPVKRLPLKAEVEEGGAVQNQAEGNLDETVDGADSLIEEAAEDEAEEKKMKIKIHANLSRVLELSCRYSSDTL